MLHPWDRRAVLGSLAGISGLGLLRPARVLAQVCSPTNSDILGPFYTAGAPNRSQIAGPKEPGDALVVRGQVLDQDCRTPLRRALLDIWQADADGQYHYEDDAFRLRGRLLTDDSGSFVLTTVVPGRYKLNGDYRPAHIHFMLRHPRHQPLTTQLYFKGDPFLGARDSCGDECDSNDPSRIVDLKKADAGRGFATDVKIILRAQRAS
jgi:catechol 1,2-dioxygenase